MADFSEWESSLGFDVVTTSCPIDEEEIPPLVEPKREENKAVEQIKKLCRVCSSNGLISIETLAINADMKVSMTRYKDHPEWRVPIAEIIAEVSGTEVSVHDTLPQFICQHCFGYLQHAYVMRLRIRQNTESLLQAQQFASEEALGLEAIQIDQTRITKREIEETYEEDREEQHFYEKFKGASIKITPNVLKTTARAVEHKCPSCKKRILSVKGLNDHMEFCAISVIDTFFTTFQELYKGRINETMTTKEFIFRAIRLVFDANKKLTTIAEKKGVDIKGISPHMPLSQPAVPLPIMRNYQSPDIGYNSEAK